MKISLPMRPQIKDSIVFTLSLLDLYLKIKEEAIIAERLNTSPGYVNILVLPANSKY